MNQQRTPIDNNRRQIIYQQTILLPSRYLSTSLNNKQSSEVGIANSYAPLRPGAGVRTPTNNNRLVAYQVGGSDQNAWPFQMTINDPSISMLNSFTNVIEYGSDDIKKSENVIQEKKENKEKETKNDDILINEEEKTEIDTNKENENSEVKSRSKRSRVSIEKVKVYTLDEVLDNILKKRNGKSLGKSAEGRLLPDGEYHMTSQLEGKPSISLESFANLLKKDDHIPEHGRRTVPLKNLPNEKIKVEDKPEKNSDKEPESSEIEIETLTTTTTTQKPQEQKKLSDKDKKTNKLFLDLFNPIQYHFLPTLPQGIYPLQYVTSAVQPQLIPSSSNPTYSLINWFRSLPSNNFKQVKKEFPSNSGTILEPENVPKDTVVLRQGGIAIAGPGGEASTGAGGTAIVGPGGIAYAEPNTLSVVGPGGRVVDSNSLARGVEQVLAWGPVIYRHPAH